MRELLTQVQIQKIKIYGERNTGTNYLAKLIGLNLSVELLPGVAPAHVQLLEKLTTGEESTRDRYFTKTFTQNLGWKHRFVNLSELSSIRDTIQHVGFVCLVKNPYAWLLSFYHSPHHYEGTTKESFSEFLVKPVQLLNRDNLLADFVTPIQLWNLKNQSYYEVVQHFDGVLLKYESLLKSPDRTIHSINSAFNVSLLESGFKNFEKSTKSDTSRDFDYYRTYYLNEVWKQDLTPELIDVINGQLDQVVMDQLNYTLL